MLSAFPRIVHRFSLTFGLLFALTGTRAAEPAPAAEFGGASPLAWSIRMADSEMAREGDRLFYHPGTKDAWNYTSGLFAGALMRLGDATKEKRFYDFAEKTIGSFILPDGNIQTYHLEQYSLDNVQAGVATLALYRHTGEERYKWAAQRLRAQLQAHPRTLEGGLWHKLKYPHQMWLDGLYMGQPFYAQYAAEFQEPAVFDDVAREFRLIAKHTYDAKAQLFYHGWDESKTQYWADKQTGRSPSFWSRAMGWYAMALVDTLDFMPKDHPGRPEMLASLRLLADGLKRYQESASGLWWQITEQGAREGNYLEASASSMFVYALAKAVNNGYLPSDPYAAVARAGYAGLIRDLVKPAEDGKIDLTHVCKVASLDTSGSVRPRGDGSFEYYTQREPMVSNDLKGVGPFITAGIEMEKLVAGGH